MILRVPLGYGTSLDQRAYAYILDVPTTKGLVLDLSHPVHICTVWICISSH